MTNLSFNPCFNGFTSLTQYKNFKNSEGKPQVSILVLMDSLL